MMFRSEVLLLPSVVSTETQSETALPGSLRRKLAGTGEHGPSPREPCAGGKMSGFSVERAKTGAGTTHPRAGTTHPCAGATRPVLV